jgi:Type II secretion system (T2SS), protein L
MTVLRVVLIAAPSPARDDAWALFDAQEHRTQSGRGTPATWPAADRREAVLAAATVRLAAVTLPPMPADRVSAAAAFALEDQLAGPAHEAHLVASPRRRDGCIDVAVTQRALIAPLAREFARVVAEPALAPIPAAGMWRWYPSAGEGGFVRKPDGSAFAVSTPAADGPVPAELALALHATSRAGATAPRVDVAFGCTDAQIAEWSRQCGTPFTRGAAWRWDADGTAIAAAPDLLQGELARTPHAAPQSALRGFRWAAGVAAAALMLHVGATFAQWAWLRFDAWQAARAIVATARDAGAGEQPDADAAALALARMFTDARHRAGLAAPGDALPLLARAAPTLAALPAGAFKSARYAAGTWTFELAKLDAAAQTALDRGLAEAGVASLQATTNAGTRMRATLAPGTERP